MAISKQKKTTMLDRYVAELQNAQAVLVAEYRGLKVADITRLRRRVEESGAKFMVVKTTLFKRALEQEGLPIPQHLLAGPVAVGIAVKDPTATARALNEFAVTSELLVIKGGLLGQREINKAQVGALATMPSRDVLLGQVLGTLQSPLSGLVNVLNGPIRGLVYVLKAREDQLSGTAA